MEVINITSNGTIVENTSNINNLQINTNVVPSSTEATEFIINNGQFEFLPSSENVDYFSKVNVAVQIPPPLEANQPLKEYTIDSIDVPFEIAIQPDIPYSSMSMVKVNNDFKSKIQQSKVVQEESGNFVFQVRPDEGYSAMRQCTIVSTPYIGYLYGCGYSDRDSKKIESLISLDSLEIAQRDGTIIDLEGWDVVIAYKYEYDQNKYNFDFPYLYCIEFTRVEYFIKQIKLKAGVAYKRFRDVQRWQSETFYQIQSQDRHHLATFRYAYIDPTHQPEDRMPTLQSTSTSICFPSNNYFYPLIEGYSITSFSEIYSPYELIYEEESNNNNN